MSNDNRLLPQHMLMIPGPTPVPGEVLMALAHPPIGHRSAAFKQVIEDVQPKLQWLFQTKQLVHTFAASGTGAMEAALINVLKPGDDLLVFACGVFSKRFANIAKTLGYNVHLMEVPAGQANLPEHVHEFFAKPESANIKAVCIIHNETSTGVMNPLPELCDAVREHSDALIIVDTVTSLGATKVKMDEWGLDIVVSGSQKGFMLPPGLAFLAASEKAMAAHRANPTPGFYFNFSQYEKSQLQGQTPYTPAVTLYMGLNTALDLMQSEGLHGIIVRHKRNKRMVRAGVRALGLDCFVQDDDFASDSVTSIVPPEGISVDAIRKGLTEDFCIVVANGQADLKGKIFRIGHLGAIFPRDILTTLAALEVVLTQNGANITAGSGVAAAQAVYIEAKKKAVACHA